VRDRPSRDIGRQERQRPSLICGLHRPPQVMSARGAGTKRPSVAQPAGEALPGRDGDPALLRCVPMGEDEGRHRPSLPRAVQLRYGEIPLSLPQLHCDIPGPAPFTGGDGLARGSLTHEPRVHLVIQRLRLLGAVADGHETTAALLPGQTRPSGCPRRSRTTLRWRGAPSSPGGRARSGVGARARRLPSPPVTALASP